MLAAAFALAHTQSPLFFSNQNQYLLHGLAHAGYGHLAHDWLANTKDPTPLFSLIVNAGYRLGGLFSIQVLFFILLMGYFAAVWQFVSATWPVRILPFAALFTAAHAAMFRLVSVRLTGVDYPWYFQSGVAGQYLLGPGLQPSAFGVLLMGSVAAYACNRVRLAAILAAGATWAHATYLFPAALLTLGYASGLATEKRGRDAAIVCGMSLLIALPVVVFVSLVFPDSGPKVNHAAESILATVRIPHHTQIGRWMDWRAGLQIVWIALGLWLLRGTRFARPLTVAALLAGLFTAIQWVAGNDQYSLLFPWRLSVLLVPIATAAVAVKIAQFDPRSRASEAFALMLVILQAAGGVAIMALGLGYQMNESEVPLLNWVREHADDSDVYLIPTKIPPVATGSRGVISTSFTPPPRPKPGSNLIPVDLQRFRLATGACVYVDFKAVPYAATEVMEWHRRVHQVEAWYGGRKWDDAATRAEMKREGITHVVIQCSSPNDPPLLADDFDLQYQDAAYAVYKLR